MNPKELRIGNYVYAEWHKSKETFQVQEIYNTHGENYSVGCTESGCQVTDYAPIPLTEEWLVKFGFEQHDVYKGCYDKDFNIIKIQFDVDGMLCYFHDGIDWGTFNYKSDYTIKYVHQLQNLYFSLTGKDLEIK